MEFVVKPKEKIKVVFGDVNFEVLKPSVKQVEAFQKKADLGLPAILDFLEELGLPKDVSGEWTIDCLNEFIEFLVVRKKN